MKIYLEATEVVDSPYKESEFIRADITDKSDSEIASIKTDIQDIMRGITYRLEKHTCRHEDGGACTAEVI